MCSKSHLKILVAFMIQLAVSEVWRACVTSSRQLLARCQEILIHDNLNWKRNIGGFGFFLTSFVGLSASEEQKLAIQHSPDIEYYNTYMSIHSISETISSLYFLNAVAMLSQGRFHLEDIFVVLVTFYHVFTCSTPAIVTGIPCFSVL